MSDTDDASLSSPAHREKIPQPQRNPLAAGIWSFRLFLVSVLLMVLPLFGHGLDGNAYFYISSSALCAVLGFVYGWKGADSWPGKVGLLGSCLMLVVFVVPSLYLVYEFRGVDLRGD